MVTSLEQAGVHVLQNECTVLEQSGEMIAIAGIEDSSFSTDYLFGDSDTVTKDILSGIIS